MTHTDTLPPCPWCKTAAHVQASGTTLRAVYCRECRREFEAGDDGIVGYGDPARFAERRERWQQRQQKGGRR